MSATVAKDTDAAATLRSVVSDSKDKLDALGAQGLSQYRETSDRMQRQLRRLKEDLADLQYAVGRNARAAARTADDYVRANPWKTAGAAAAVAALVVAAAVIVTRR